MAANKYYLKLIHIQPWFYKSILISIIENKTTKIIKSITHICIIHSFLPPKIARSPLEQEVTNGLAVTLMK